MINDIINAKEIAQLLRLHPKTVIYLAKKGEIPHFWVGGSLRFLRSDIEGYIEEQRQKSTRTNVLSTA